MGRHSKSVVTDTGLDRRESGYYSTPAFIGKFLAAELLRIKPDGLTVLDPCVGREELLEEFFRAGKTIDSFDVEDFGIHQRANFRQIDFLKFFSEYFASPESNRLKEGIRACDRQGADRRNGAGLHYDYYIANPPYNCHETDYIRTNKEQLQKLFPEIGVTNMYSMFISALISLAKDGAVIGLITFDSFLTAGMHTRLREQILRECSVHSLILCPTDLFRDQRADVRTCLLVLQKGPQYQGQIKIGNRTLDKKEFRLLLEKDEFHESCIENIVLVNQCDSSEFVVGCPDEIKSLFKGERLGELYRCITGISTGNDKKYISREMTGDFSIPFFKNPGSRRFFCEPDGYLPTNFLEIEKQVPNFMVRNKDLLFREGITCSSMGVPFTACYLPANSTYGVNANIIVDQQDIWWLISYLNSSLVTYFVRGVLIRTNMITSGYVSRIPIVPLSPAVKSELSRLGRAGFENKLRNSDARSLVASIDKLIHESCKFSDEAEFEIARFSKNVLQLT